jgi:hypothetical protein
MWQVRDQARWVLVAAAAALVKSGSLAPETEATLVGCKSTLGLLESHAQSF